MEILRIKAKTISFGLFVRYLYKVSFARYPKGYRFPLG